MQALSLWRPYPWAFFYPPPGWRKSLENRDWTPPKGLIGQRFALHAGQKYDSDGHDFIRTTLNGWQDIGGAVGLFPEMAHTGIIGTVKLLGWMDGKSWDDAFDHMRVHIGKEGHLWPRTHPDQRRWFIGRYAWIVTEPRLLSAPIPCRGFQKLWTLPPDVVAQIEATEKPA